MHRLDSRLFLCPPGRLERTLVRIAERLPGGYRSGPVATAAGRVLLRATCEFRDVKSQTLQVAEELAAPDSAAWPVGPREQQFRIAASQFGPTRQPCVLDRSQPGRDEPLQYVRPVGMPRRLREVFLRARGTPPDQHPRQERQGLPS